MSNEKLITVTSPLLPDLKEFEKMLEDIWDRKWLTNNGFYHKELEKALAEYLGVPYISLFTNGTLPLITALQALRITGEVITKREMLLKELLEELFCHIFDKNNQELTKDINGNYVLTLTPTPFPL